MTRLRTESASLFLGPSFFLLMVKVQKIEKYTSTSTKNKKISLILLYFFFFIDVDIMPIYRAFRHVIPAREKIFEKILKKKVDKLVYTC